MKTEQAVVFSNYITVILLSSTYTMNAFDTGPKDPPTLS